MDKENFKQEHIIRMKKYLPILRKAAGWKAEDLGELIGVTRQTITSLEKNEGYKMTKTQYIALRSVFYREAECTKNESLKHLIELLVLKDNLTDEEEKKISATVKNIYAQIGRSVNSAGILAGMTALLGMFGYALAALPAAGSVVKQGNKTVYNEAKKKKTESKEAFR